MAVHPNSVISTRINDFDPELYDAITRKENFCYNELVATDLTPIPGETFYKPYFISLNSNIIAWMDVNREQQMYTLVTTLSAILTTESINGVDALPNFMANSRDYNAISWFKDGVLTIGTQPGLKDNYPATHLQFTEDGSKLETEFDVSSQDGVWTVALRLNRPDEAFNQRPAPTSEFEVEILSGDNTVCLFGVAMCKSNRAITTLSDFTQTEDAKGQVVSLNNSNWHIVQLQFNVTGFQSEPLALRVRSVADAELDLYFDVSSANPGKVLTGWRETTTPFTTPDPAFSVLSSEGVYVMNGYRARIKTDPDNYYDDGTFTSTPVPSQSAPRLEADIALLSDAAAMVTTEDSAVDSGVTEFSSRARVIAMSSVLSSGKPLIGIASKEATREEILEVRGLERAITALNTGNLSEAL